MREEEMSKSQRRRHGQERLKEEEISKSHMGRGGKRRAREPQKKGRERRKAYKKELGKVEGR